MPALSLNGIDLSRYLAHGGWTRLAPVTLGERRRAFGGGLRFDVSGELERFKGRTVPVTAEVGAALRGLIEGHGDALLFEDRWTVRGVEGSATGTYGAHGGVHGDELKLTAPDVFSVDLSDVIGSVWSVFGWRNEDVAGAGVWEHHIIRSDGDAWIDGVAGSPVADVDVTAGVLSFDPDAAALTTGAYDDWCAVPYLVPSEWVGELYAWHQTIGIAHDLLRPLASGDLMPSIRLVKGLVTGAQFVPHKRGGVWTVNAETLEFTLEDRF